MRGVSENEVRVGAPGEKSLKTLQENRERQCWGEMCGETVPEIGGGDWKGLPADSSEVYKMVGSGWSESQSRWHVRDSGEVGRQVHWSIYLLLLLLLLLLLIKTINISASLLDTVTILWARPRNNAANDLLTGTGFLLYTAITRSGQEQYAEIGIQSCSWLTCP